MELHGIKDKVVIITGGGRGIGKSAGIALAQSGAKVVIVSRTQAEVEDTVKEIKNASFEAMGIVADVTKEDKVQEMVRGVLEKYGNIDVLINNAGVSFRKTLLDTTLEDWEKLMAVNLKGMYLCTREVLSLMIKKRSGRIINVSSRAGNQPFEEHAAYCTSKYGIIGFTEAMAMELAKHNIHVNVVCPDRILSEMSRANIPKGEDLKNWMTTDELAGVFVFLVSDEAKTINGAKINSYGFAGFGIAGFGTAGFM